MSENQLQIKKENLHRQRRKQQLEKRFAQKRKLLSTDLSNREKQLFVSLLPRLNADNYEQNRVLLSQYARSDHYSYQLIPMLGICYEYLDIYPEDEPSWEIVAYLSYYEDFQMPKTYEFAQKLCNFLQKNATLGAELVLNLSKLSKCSLICLQLIQCNVLELIQQILRNSQQKYQILTQTSNPMQAYEKQLLENQILSLLLTLGYFFTLKPILPKIQMKKICSILNYNEKAIPLLNEFHSESKFRLITNVLQNFSSQRSVVEIVVRQFQSAITNQFFTYEYEAVKLVSCSVKLHIQIPKSLVKNTFMTVKSKQLKNKLLALKTLQQFLSVKTQVQKMQVQQKREPKLFYIEKLNQLPTLQDFLSEFRPKENIALPFKQEFEIKNRLVFYSVLFTEEYSKQYKILLEIVESSKQQIKFEIIKFIKLLLECLIRQAQSFHPEKMVQSEFQSFSGPQFLSEFLRETINQQYLYTIIRMCLQTNNVQLIKLCLEMLEQILCYLMDKECNSEQRSQQGQNLGQILNLLQQNSITSILQYHQLHHENGEIKDMASSILQLISPSEEQIQI